MDILIDFATVVLPFFLLHDLHIAWGQKLPAMIAFALRALYGPLPNPLPNRRLSYTSTKPILITSSTLTRIIPIIIARLIFLSLSSSTDHPYDDFSTTIITSIHINLSVIITCLPFLKTVIDSLQTGLLASDLRILGPNRMSHHHALGYLGKGARLAGQPVPASNKRFGDREDKYSATATVGSGPKENPWNNEGGRRLDLDSPKEKMVINHTTTMSVQYM